MKNAVKNMLFGSTEKVFNIKYGIAKGLKMSIDPRSKTQRIIGLDEVEIQKKFKEYSLVSNIFLDIGSSDGYYSLIYKKYNPNGLALLFDADKRFAEEQKNNLHINGLDKNYHIYSKYVSNVKSETSVCVDDILTEYGSSGKTIFMKIDVEGAELAVLEGLKNALSKENCKLIIETHSKQLEIDCIKFLEDRGYKTGVIENAWWRFLMPELRVSEHNRWLSAEK